MKLQKIFSHPYVCSYFLYKYVKQGKKTFRLFCINFFDNNNSNMEAQMRMLTTFISSFDHLMIERKFISIECVSYAICCLLLSPFLCTFNEHIESTIFVTATAVKRLPIKYT